MLYEWIMEALIMPQWLPVDALHGRWSHLYDSWSGFFWLFGLIVVPGLILAAPPAFSLEGLAASRLSLKRYHALVAVGGTIVYALLASVMLFVSSLGSEYAMFGGFSWTAPLIYVAPVSALSVLGFWLPSISVGLYTSLAKRPRWWVAAIIGTVAVVLGVWLWVLFGNAIGAETD